GGRGNYFTALNDRKTPVRTLLAWSQAARDVCATCHTNATCEDKLDGSGKVCNCNHGFVGNGINFCQDKNECQIGTIKICGQHTTCHNTYGSYYCTCLSGYSPSNNMAVFIPNDGTHCQDIDECGITGICGEGGRCRNLEGSFDCSCQVGYRVHNGAEPFHPQRDGASCEEILCGEPPVVPHTAQVWNSSVTPGSTATYYCKTGFYHQEGSNVSVCAGNGYWTVPGILCKEIGCGEPTPIPHALLWDGSSAPGSVAKCECLDGFYQESGNNLSTCSQSGLWGEVSVKYVEFVATEETACDSLSIPNGFQRSAATSTAGHIGVFLPDVCCQWCNSDLPWVLCGMNHAVSEVLKSQNDILFKLIRSRCKLLNAIISIFLCETEIKPPIDRLKLHNGNCLKWKAEKYEEDTEVIYLGSRDYQRSFLDKGWRFLRSKDDWLRICLNLLPLTNYSISITAVTARFTATITASTSLTVPPAPAVYYAEFETPVPTLRLQRSPNTLDPISFYQIFVLPVEEILMFDCSSPASLDPSAKTQSLTEYMTAQLVVQNLATEVNFTVGDGSLYGGFYNAPLESGNTYFIVLRVVSQWKKVSRNCYKIIKVRLCSGMFSRPKLTVSFSRCPEVAVSFGLK
uniref:Sushi domain containing 1 n=1 Tax=Fundulus heteroclitus TaxID=8078 RepID=A0A3Q2QCS1_FUNHE